MAIVKKVRKLGTRPGFGTAARESSARRPVFVPRSAPCEHGCPNGTDVRAFLTSLAKANTRQVTAEAALQQAFDVLVERNPLPGVTGRLCPHHCEARCNREAFDGPVAINLVERAVAVAALEHGLRLPEPAGLRTERVAVIGTGAAGLSAAYQLARRGYRVTMFDTRAAPGGELRDPALWGEEPPVVAPWAPPSLPLLDAEIARIAALGVHFECGLGREPDPAVFTRIVRTRLQEGGPVNPAAIPAAIHYGRHAADTLDLDVRGVAPVTRGEAAARDQGAPEARSISGGAARGGTPRGPDAR